VADPWSTLSERVVMVGRYSERDGIARYAEQLIEAHGGRTFVRVGILEGPGDYHRNFHRGPRALWLLRDARRRDDVVVHYHPHYFIRGVAASHTLSYLSWGAVALLRRVTVVVHEFDPEDGGRIESAARRWMWRRPARLAFHSEWQRARHKERFGRGWRQELLLVEHGDFFSTDVDAGRAEARVALALPADRAVLLMIGFISASDPDKGYDRALAAVEAAEADDVELRIVGSPIREAPDVDALLATLREASRTSPRVFLHEQFVDDHAFDLWIRAADAVLTPYRTASSSGVVARAHLLGTRVVMSDAGGLKEQAADGDIVVATDDELADAVRTVADDSRQARSASNSR
jgi:glycosyltransferase involved in cell wall biosynthesis